VSVRVLIADDDQDVRLAVRALLESEGLEIVGEATNGLEAVELTGSLRPDAVVMDMLMPVLDGVSATRRIKELWPATEVVGFTSSADAFGEAMFASGADETLDKTDFEVLPEVIRKSARSPGGRAGTRGTGDA
jgi:CheY-like chemotaxis protein